MIFKKINTELGGLKEINEKTFACFLEQDMKNQAEGRVNVVYRGEKKIAVPARFLSAFNSFSRLLKVC